MEKGFSLYLAEVSIAFSFMPFSFGTATLEMQKNLVQHIINWALV